ncbi:MAG: DNA-binding domain-containing protein [Pseudomonadales bacterium]
MAAEESPGLFDQLRSLPAHIRDPRRAPPPGVDERAAAVYRELFFNSLDGLLRAHFPVLCRTLGDAVWRQLVADFLRDHRANTPLFPEIGEELIAFLQARQAAAEPDPPWVPELAHFEWVELALEIDPAVPDANAFEADADVLAHVPVLSPHAVVLVYRYAVHRIVEGSVPTAPSDTPVCLLAVRDAAGRVRLSETNPFTVQLIERLGANTNRSGRELLLALAADAGAQSHSVLEGGAELFRQLQRQGVILGARRTAT